MSTDERSEVSAVTLKFMPNLALPSALMDRIEAAETLAQSGVAKADNARQMVLNRDPRLSAVETEANTLAQVAATVQQTAAAAEATHAELARRIDQIALTPGPAGPAGPAGTANIAVAAAPVGLLALGGNVDVTLTWNRTLGTSTYAVHLAHSAVVNLATVTLTVKTKTTTAAVVNVKSNGVAIAAGTLLAVAA